MLRHGLFADNNPTTRVRNIVINTVAYLVQKINLQTLKRKSTYVP